MKLAQRCARALAMLGMAAALVGAVVAPVAGQTRALAGAAIRATEAVQRAAPAVQLREVMGPGADVDGDGAADFVNPTGHSPRAVDDYGSGAFHASRDGGARDHEGVDYLAKAGQSVAAPISGYVTRIGYAYADDQALRYVELTNPAIGYVARVFYVSPSVAVGDPVRLGRPIGTVLSLQGRYPGISDHVHVETTRAGRGHVDPTALIPTPSLRLARVAGQAPG
jgi:murein DD-endopeptidase MepM/ murein hydrolase activator NlpD